MNDLNQLPQLLKILDEAGQTLGTPCFMVGRLAIALQFSGKVSDNQIAKTRDIDFAFMIRSWDDYDRLRRHLLSGDPPLFREDDKQRQRLIFNESLIVDMIPAGGVADKSGQARWPPDGSPAMNVQGFEDAFADTEWKKFGSARARIASPRGIALLKFIAWNDRHDRTKDIDDIAFIMRHYDKIVGDDRLYSGPDHDLLESGDFDLQVAWARILGRDIGRMIIHPATADCLNFIFQRELSEPFPLVSLLQNSLICPFEIALRILEDLTLGVNEGWKQTKI